MHNSLTGCGENGGEVLKENPGFQNILRTSCTSFESKTISLSVVIEAHTHKEDEARGFDDRQHWVV